MTVDIVLLAAGFSRRMARDKLLLPYRGTTLLRHAALQALGVPNSRLLVAIGKNQEQRLAALQGLDFAVVTVDRPEEGLSASLRAALAAVNPACEAVVLSLADLPLLRTAHYQMLLDAYLVRPGAYRLADTDRRPGHPVILPASSVSSLSDLTGDTGARALFDLHPPELIVSGPAAVTDIDTPEDYARLIGTG